MEFCPRCGTRLVASRPRILACPRCGYERVEEEGKPISQVTRQTSDNSIVVIDQSETRFRVLPTVRAECPKCKGKNAYAWTTNISDEETTVEIQVFRCTLCGHTWRERG